MPITPAEARPLAALVNALRPTWNVPGILAVLKECQHRPEPAGVIAQAMIRCAMDRDEARTPAALIARPSYWNLEQPLDYARPVLTPEHECPEHVGQWAATCSPCHGVAKGITPETDPTPAEVRPGDGYDPTAATLGDYFRQEARVTAARAHEQYLATEAAKRPEVVHVVTDVPATPQPNDGEGTVTHA